MNTTLAVLVTFMALLSGCQSARYEYTAPASEAGKQCVRACDAISASCRADEDQRAETERMSCERLSDLNVELCDDHGKGKNRTKTCADSRRSCHIWPNHARCYEEYRRCFSNCGGVVKTVTQ